MTNQVTKESNIMAYSNLQAPITNAKAAQQLADTQAIRMRAAVGAAPTSTPIAQAAQQTGAALTASAGEQALKQQQQQAQVAGAQAQNVLQSQKLGQQQQLFQQESALDSTRAKLDQTLFNINQQAANEENRLTNNFSNRVAQSNHLMEMDLLTWTAQNAKTEDEFKDRIQSIEQAHAKQTAMVNHAYKLQIQSMEQARDKATQDRKQEYNMEIARLKAEWEKEQTRQRNKAKNRQAMYSAGGTILGAGLAVAAIASIPLSAGTTTPMVLAAASTGAGIGGALGNMAAAK